MLKKQEQKENIGFIWNVIGGGLVAGQSAILMIFAARFYGQETAGIISIAYALAVLCFTIARYGIRNYQVTDSDEKYAFEDYLKSRYISVFVSLLISLIYLIMSVCINGYGMRKVLIIIFIVLLRMVNAVEDVYLGRFQQMGHFAIGARIMAIRELVVIVVLSVLMILRMDVVVALAIGIVVSIFIDVFMIKRAHELLELSSVSSTNKTRQLLAECLPLCVGTSLAIYASNIPKYVTDWYLDEYSQAIVGYLILPVFIVALFNQFIYTPFIKGLGDLWDSNNVKAFRNKIIKQALVILGLSVIVLGATLLVGIPLLSWVYAIDLAPYRIEFVLLLAGGTLYALEYYLAIPVTIVRKQKQLALGYLVAIAISLVMQKSIVTNYGLIGVALIFVAVNFVITLFFAGIIAASKPE